VGNSSRSYGVINCCHCSRCSTELRDITLARQAPIRRALGGEAKDGGGPLPARSQAHRELVSAVSARAGSRAVDRTQAEAVGALCLFRYHRKSQSARQLPAPGHRRVAEMVEPPLATGLDIVGGNAPAACALSAATAAHPSLHRHVAKPWAEEPDAGDPPVRFGGSGGAILRPYPYHVARVLSCRCTRELSNRVTEQLGGWPVSIHDRRIHRPLVDRRHEHHADHAADRQGAADGGHGDDHLSQQGGAEGHRHEDGQL